MLSGAFRIQTTISADQQGLVILNFQITFGLITIVSGQVNNLEWLRIFPNNSDPKLAVGQSNCS